MKKIVEARKKLDWLWWTTAFTLLIGGIVGNSLLQERLALPLRLIAWIVILLMVIGILMMTTQGKAFKLYFKEARMELRKVVWLTRQETMKTTFIIIVTVLVTAIFMWSVDSFLLWVIGWLTGQRG